MRQSQIWAPIDSLPIGHGLAQVPSHFGGTAQGVVMSWPGHINDVGGMRRSHMHARKDNGEAIRKVCCEFVVLCRRLELFSEASVAIDGSKFKAVNTRDRNFTQAKMQRRLAQIDESIARYLSQLDSADRQGEAVPEAKITRLNEKIVALRKEIKRLNALNTQMIQTEDKQISLTDPDARSMATSGRVAGWSVTMCKVP